ncbi:hypothetical protein D9V62_02120 [Buchnera aphidicola (Aphis helianthi)]|uniref:M23ase beta-sheet core domain-containing protein n=1 Tax=Buchnera aphidicola (Aphis helianthi) TaxID=2315802 RepID=A0A4D6XQJ1_9GAMM|nr:hypothetical protein D9V62_02120 [Buchnera aphidicola (Aphis helianthi)]
MQYNNFHKPYTILVGQKILVNNIPMINSKKINYVIYSNQYKKHILYTNFFKNKLNIINILNQNMLLSEICFFYNKDYNKENYVFSKKNIFPQYWHWPLKNLHMNFFYNYSINNNQGIEIAGIQGQPIFASSKGKVVYIGGFFKNYGKLIIIKHDNNYLSMYGFNKNIFVQLNDQVYKSQKISTMGYSNNNLSRLYFEIRCKGNTINLFNLFPNIKLKNIKKFN